PWAAASTARAAAAPTASAAGATAATATAATATAATAGGLLRRVELRQVGGEALGHDLALVDPYLHADPAEGRAGLVEAVVDVGAHRVERHATVRVALGTRHLGAAQPA